MSGPDAAVARELPTGAGTMSPAMAKMQAYPRYLFDRVAPQLRDRVWEIGVGYGTYTAWLRDAGKSVLATDIDDECLRRATAKFAGDDRVRTAPRRPHGRGDGPRRPTSKPTRSSASTCWSTSATTLRPSRGSRVGRTGGGARADRSGPSGPVRPHGCRGWTLPPLHPPIAARRARPVRLALRSSCGTSICAERPAGGSTIGCASRPGWRTRASTSRCAPPTAGCRGLRG